MPTKGKTIYLIDGSGFIHRAFHAIRDLRTSSGFPTNALYGLASMLRKFIREKQPEYCAVVFDAGRVTFRNEIYPDYKANREEAPEELALQFPYARELVRAFGIPLVELEGYEADDIIATLARKALADGFRVVIVSSDKDLYQVVSEDVLIFDPHSEKLYDPDAVQKKLGVAPHQVVDFLALVGDPTDNVPGVKGVGYKGAAQLISRFGSLEAALQRLEAMPPRLRKALQAGKESAILSKRLVRLRDDVPVDELPRDLRPKGVDQTRLSSLLVQLEFTSLLSELEGASKIAVQRSEVEVHRVVDGESLRSLEEGLRKSRMVTLVAHFSGLDPVEPNVVALGVCPKEGAAFVFSNGMTEQVLRLLAGIEGGRLVVADYKRVLELFMSRSLDLALPGLDPLLAGYLLHPEREQPTLQAMAMEFLSESLPPAGTADSAGRYAAAAYHMTDMVEKKLRDEGLYELLQSMEIPLAAVLARMERWGVFVDEGALASLSSELGRRMVELEVRIHRAAGTEFNPNSPKQLAEVLFGKLQLPVIKKTKSGASTAVGVLEELSRLRPDCPVPSLILQYRSLAKLKSTYADTLPRLIHPRTGRIHTSYNQMVAATGRLSSSHPNLQNIPIRTDDGKRIRRAFVPQEGYVFVSADYSQIELRVLAHMSGDPDLVRAFEEGVDIHARTAAKIFHCNIEDVTPEMRRAAKTINFGLLYGMSPHRLTVDLGIDHSAANRFIDEYFAVFPRVKDYLHGTVEEARRLGFARTLCGRKRPIQGLDHKDKNARSAAERIALNTPIQGSAADIMKLAMIALCREIHKRGLDARMVLQVHDELVLEVRRGHEEETTEVLKRTMEGAFCLRVPLVVDVAVGESWAEL